MSTRGGHRALLLGFLLAWAPCAQTAESEPAEPDPFDIGLFERTGRALMFLDVEVTDEEGRPIPGLVKSDFKIVINYRRRKIYSVDSLCPCSAEADPAEQRVEPGRVAAEDPARRAGGVSKPRYILYFDFSQLQIDGRVQALEEARRWILEVKQPSDLVQIVAYSDRAGVRKLSGFTRDTDELLQALDETERSTDLVDPFPVTFAERWIQCRDGVITCYAAGRREWLHARQSLRALRNYVTDLDAIPERKALIFFHQNNTIYPGRLFSLDGHFSLNVRPESRSDLLPEDVWRMWGQPTADDPLSELMLDGTPTHVVPDLVALVDEVGGTATATRTTIYPLVAGSGSRWSVNLGANLADFTGGRFNRSCANLGAVLEHAGRGCACIYRIGLIAPERERSRVYRTKVRVQGRALGNRHRVQYLTRSERWERRAQSVLIRPEEVEDLEVLAALVPMARRGKDWDLRVQVALDVDSLLLRPSGDAEEGAWEVGALLFDADGDRTWEMLGVSRIRRGGGSGQDADILHERTFEGLAPGRYEVRAFVRDRSAGLYGGARAYIELPDLKRHGFAGPILLRPRGRHLLTELPLRRKKRSGVVVRNARLTRGALPRDQEAVIVGEPVEFVTWVCTGGKLARPDDLILRRLRVGDTAIELNARPELDKAGDCFSLRDRLDTAGWREGEYVYEVWWAGDDPKATVARTRNFRLLRDPESAATAPAIPVPTAR